MSKPVRKHRRSRKRIEPRKHKVSPPAKRPGGKPFMVFIIIAILAAIPFCMGKYFEFNSPGAFDSGAYVYSAKHILDGAKIGVEEKPSAQMGTLLVNMLGVRLCGFSETGPKLIQTILQAAALVLMFIAMVKLFGVLPAAVGVIIASIYLSAPLMAKYGNVKEQHMIAFMVLGVSCFVLYQLGSRWWLACLAGAFLSWAPMFKETGISAIGAVGLFVIVQPLLKHRSWKKTGTDILLLLAGAALIISPICLWLATTNVSINYFPYSSFWRPIAKVFQVSQNSSEHKTTESDTETDEGVVQNAPVERGLLMKLMPSYVRDSWQILKPEQIKQAKLRVFRWYWVLILPIALALGSIITRVIILISNRVSLVRRSFSEGGSIKHRSSAVASAKAEASRSYDRFVLLFAVWWLLDMTFVWISPRSYEQYYLPLNASAAMLGGYLIAIYHNKLKSTAYKPIWVLTGFVGIVLMIIMSQHIFFGLKKSPHSGVIYTNPATRIPEKDKGYAQKLNEISRRQQYPWLLVSEYIRNNSTSSDKIYVWGWVPGIYVQAQRLSPTPKAFEGVMHTLTPQVLSERVDEILGAFEKEPPKFIVDSRKSHFPWDRPPLELWPRTQKGFLPAVPQIVSQYDALYTKDLREQIGPDEALRYESMKPFREYVMKNYKIVQRPFGANVLFQRK